MASPVRQKVNGDHVGVKKVTLPVLVTLPAQSFCRNPDAISAMTKADESPGSSTKRKLTPTTPSAKRQMICTSPGGRKRSLRSLRSLAKVDPSRPWTVDPAILKQADKTFLKKKLFEVVDNDGNGHIHFSEFLELQRELMASDSFLDEVGFDVGHWKAQCLENEFRKWDANFNNGLDELEWEDYIETMITVVGKQALHRILDNLLIQRQSLKRQETVDDRCMSERLLEKAKNTHYLGKSNADQAHNFLAKGADPNFVDANGESVMHHVAAKCEPSFILKLIEHGGKITLNSKELDSAVLVAARARRLDVLRVLLFPQLGNRETHREQCDEDLSSRLIHEMHDLQDKQIRDLVRQGADINFRNTQGWIPLTSAVFWGRKDCVELLIRLPVTNPSVRLHVDTPNIKGRTALHVAVRKGRVDLIPLLVGARADVNARDMDGWTPLHHAVFNSRSEAVRTLYGHGAKMNLQSYGGITPFMLASSVDRVTVPLTGDAIELLQPPENVRFTEAILPILKNDALLPYEKLTALMDLPGVCGVLENLRLHDQLFRMNRGPNRVQLNKLWDLLCCEMMKRLRSGEVDLEPLGPHCSNAQAADVWQETMMRQEKQRKFVEAWLVESAGPPTSSEWTWDNREGYREKITALVKAEMAGFQKQCESMYAALAKQPGGEELLSLPRNEILQQQYLTQLGAHPILKWIDCADPVEAFYSLCDVKAFGSNADDNDALGGFMDLISTDADFMTSSFFWRNVYKLWLSSYARIARPNFQGKLQRFLNDFNTKNMEQGFEVSLSDLHSKTYQDMKTCEVEYGQPGYQTHDERVLVSKALNAISCSIVASSPAAVAHFVYSLRQLTLTEDKFELVRIQNGFHKDAETRDGFREVVANIVFKGGHCHGHGARESRTVSVLLVAEVRITLPEIASAHQGMKLFSEFIDGKFDPSL